MLKLLGGLKEFIKRRPVTIDGTVFRVHVTFTTVVLLACSIMVTATQYVGNPIQCIVEGLPTRPVNTYCWITSTFTMPDAFRREQGVSVAHPGVGPEHDGGGPAKYYTYYQWVCFALFFQAMMCYFPKWLWDMQEGGLMSTLVMGLHFGLGAERERENQKKILVHYMLTHIKVSNALRAPSDFRFRPFPLSRLRQPRRNTTAVGIRSVAAYSNAPNARALNVSNGIS